MELSELSSTLEQLELNEQDAINFPPKEIWRAGTEPTLNFLREGGAGLW